MKSKNQLYKINLNGVDMQIFRQKETFEETKVKEYIDRYVKELQRHFDLPNKKIRIILYRVYKDLSPFSFVKASVFKLISMIKSKCFNRRIKRK